VIINNIFADVLIGFVECITIIVLVSLVAPFIGFILEYYNCFMEFIRSCFNRKNMRK